MNDLRGVLDSDPLRPQHEEGGGEYLLVRPRLKTHDCWVPGIQLEEARESNGSRASSLGLPVSKNHTQRAKRVALPPSGGAGGGREPPGEPRLVENANRLGS